MNPEPPPLPPKPPQKPIALAVVLAFVPSAIALLLLSINVPKHQIVTCCVPAAFVAIACCVASSIMLFKRKTAAAIVFGVLLALLNVAITLGLGCAALFADFTVR